jgi:hypothetical protein
MSERILVVIPRSGLRGAGSADPEGWQRMLVRRLSSDVLAPRRARITGEDVTPGIGIEIGIEGDDLGALARDVAAWLASTSADAPSGSSVEVQGADEPLRLVVR